MVGWQLAGSLPKPFAGVVAYEPVWAIGTGKNATEQDVATMHAFIREELVRQFGEAGRASASCMAARCGRRTPPRCWPCRMSAGALIGGASLKAEDFLAIARAAAGLVTSRASRGRGRARSARVRVIGSARSSFRGDPITLTRRCANLSRRRRSSGTKDRA